MFSLAEKDLVRDSWGGISMHLLLPFTNTHRTEASLCIAALSRTLLFTIFASVERLKP